MVLEKYDLLKLGCHPRQEGPEMISQDKMFCWVIKLLLVFLSSHRYFTRVPFTVDNTHPRTLTSPGGKNMRRLIRQSYFY